MKIKRTMLAMALTVPLVCGTFLGLLPGRNVLRVQAAEAGAGMEVLQEEEGETLETPTDLHWICGQRAEENAVVIGGVAMTRFNFSNGTKYEFELMLYQDGQKVKTISCGPTGAVNQYVSGWMVDNDGSIYQHSLGFQECGIWTFRVRAVSADGQRYSDWSEESYGVDNTKESFLAYLASLETGNNDSEVSEPASSEADDVDDIDDRNDTVTTSSGEVLTSAAAIYVNSITPAVVRTPQAEVNAAVASAVGGLKEGQSVTATVGDSQCGELARQAVTNAAASVNGKVVSYLEITIDLCTPGEPTQQVAQLSAPVEFMLAAPEGIDGNQYDFAVIRLHGDGRVDILPDLDNDPATITFQTDRFSVYGVVYGPKGAFKSSGKDSVPKTGDSTVPVLPFAAAGTACMAAAVILRRKGQA